MSYPDFSQKQVLFLASQDTKDISFQNDNLLVRENGKKVNQVPCSKIFALFIFGECTLTTVLIRKFTSYGIAIFLLKRNCQTFAAIGSQTEGNTLLRRKQYEEKNSLEIAKHLIANKLQNQILLLRSVRSEESFGHKQIAESIENILKDVPNAPDIASLMGMEGSGAKLFFSCYFFGLGWHGRKPRTKYDIPNLLLDIGYTYMFNFVDALLRLYGFDTYCGNLHQEFYLRKSLACDIVEPFRCIIDKALRKAWNLKQVNEKDFTIHQGQYVLKFEQGYKYSRVFLEAIMAEKEGIFKFVQSYYRTIMNGKSELPTFTPA